MSNTNSTYSKYSTSLSAQNAFSSPSDISGIIFEFTAINISNTFSTLPTFENYAIFGFPDVSAIAEIKIPSSVLNTLFYFQGDDVSSNKTMPAMYGINMNFLFNFLYSDASLTYGAIHNNGVDVKDDYVNYLSYAITGGSNLVDIFSNTSNLLQEVVNMNNRFNDKIQTSLNSINSIYNTSTSTTLSINNNNVFFDTQYNPCVYLQGCKALLDGLLSITSTPRGIQFLTDIQNQSDLNPGNSIYYIKFHPGDVLSLLINYVPYNGNGISIVGPNLVYTRSYKIMLMCQ
jgi:hypothetical protein